MIWKKKLITLKLDKLFKTFNIYTNNDILLLEMYKEIESKNPTVGKIKMEE